MVKVADNMGIVETSSYDVTVWIKDGESRIWKDPVNGYGSYIHKWGPIVDISYDNILRMDDVFPGINIGIIDHRK